MAAHIDSVHIYYYFFRDWPCPHGAVAVALGHAEKHEYQVLSRTDYSENVFFDWGRARAMPADKPMIKVMQLSWCG